MKKIIVAVLFLLTSCKAPSPLIHPQGRYFTFMEMGDSLSRSFASARYGTMLDAVYFVPDLNQIRAIVKSVKIEEPYEPESHDCDDFAQEYRVKLQSAWRAAGHEVPLAIGVIYALIEEKDGSQYGHAFNFIMASDGHPIFIEPQWAAPCRHKIVEISYVEI